MTLSPLELLSLPGLASSATRAVGRVLNGKSPFASKLDQATAEIDNASLPVKIGQGVDLKLSDDQMQRLASAADRAEQQGAHETVVMLDGMAIELDVTMRTVRGTIDTKGGISTQIDSIVFAEPPSSSPTTGGLRGLADNADVLKILADGEAA
ncbi:MAG TPA: hypothetical protein ENJ00_11250 [Phycisphaerales bacterium]|nr:hypothetical protein [Phycisphaerales bacterium]